MDAKGEKEFQKYLLGKGLISKEDLDAVAEIKQDTNVSLGMIAINRGMLTFDQVRQLLDAQNQEALKFGQAALQRKFLTRKQLRALLAEQERVNLQPAEILVLTGRLSHPQLLKEQRAFARLKKSPLSSAS